jgi:hypothetical protein
MIDLETRLHELARPTTPRPPATPFEQIERRGRARADRQRRAVVAGSVAAAALLLVALAAMSRASTSQVISGAPATSPAPASTADAGWTVNPSIAGTAPVGSSHWTARIDYDPSVWSFSAIASEVRAVTSGLAFPAGSDGWGMADEHGGPPIAVSFDDTPAGRAAADAVANDLRGKPGIRSVEVQPARIAPRSPGQGSVR